MVKCVHLKTYTRNLYLVARASDFWARAEGASNSSAPFTHSGPAISHSNLRESSLARFTFAHEDKSDISAREIWPT